MSQTIYMDIVTWLGFVYGCNDILLYCYNIILLYCSLGEQSYASVAVTLNTMRNTPSL